MRRKFLFPCKMQFKLRIIPLSIRNIFSRTAECTLKNETDAMTMEINSEEEKLLGEDESDNVSSSSESVEQDIDEILEKDGPFGCYHVLIQLATFYLFLVTVYNFVFTFFTGNDPGWRCGNNSISHFCELNHDKNILIDNDLFQKRCSLNRSEWVYLTPRKYSFVTEFDLICGKTWLAALISSAYYIGGVLGSVVTGPFSDKYGRVYVLLFCTLFTTTASIGSSYITNIWELFILNMIQGAGSVACFYTTIVYQSEFSAPKYRSLATSVLLFGATCSFLYADVLAYFVRRWRHLSMFASLPTVPIICVLFVLPESPRWLLATGKKKKAERVMQKIFSRCSGNDHTIRLKTPIVVASKVKSYSYLDLARHRKVLKQSTAVILIWFVLPVVYYSIALQSSNLGGNMYEAFALSAIADLPSYCASTYLSNKIGRKRTNLGGLFVSGLLMGSMAFVPKHLSYKFTINLTISMMARFFVCNAFCGMYTWTFELFPTILRSQALSLCAVADRLGMFAVPFVIELLSPIAYFLPSLMLCVFALLASLIGLSLPETNNQPTKEHYEDFFDTPSTATASKPLVDSVTA